MAGDLNIAVVGQLPAAELALGDKLEPGALEMEWTLPLAPGVLYAADATARLPSVSVDSIIQRTVGFPVAGSIFHAMERLGLP